MRYEAGKFMHLAAPALLPHNNVLSIFEDAESDIWVGTQGGLERLSPSVATTVTTSDGTLQSINTVYQDPRGELLVAGLNGRLFRVSHQVLEPVRLPRGVMAEIPRLLESGCRATHTAGVRSGRHLIGRSASPGRIVEK